jgi:hypothetical protein
MTTAEIPYEWAYVTPDLGCGLRSIRYDIASRTGYAYLPASHCVNMSTVIDLFTRIDPAVQVIYTIAGDVPDTSYHLDPDGWRARPSSVQSHFDQRSPYVLPVSEKPRPILGGRKRKPLPVQYAGSAA